MEQRLWQVEELVRGKPAGWREYLVAVTTPVSRSRENSRGGLMVTWPILTTFHLLSPDLRRNGSTGDHFTYLAGRVSSVRTLETLPWQFVDPFYPTCL